MPGFEVILALAAHDW
ncbi:PGF-CTERM sorting domain-containing protein [Chryseobacterium oranimense]